MLRGTAAPLEYSDNLLRVAMCCYQQCILLWGGNGRQKEQEEVAVWFHRGRDSLIYPWKAQRNWRRIRRIKLNPQKKADSRGLYHF